MYVAAPFPTSNISIGVGAGGAGGRVTLGGAQSNGQDGDQSYISQLTFMNTNPSLLTIRAAGGGGGISVSNTNLDGLVSFGDGGADSGGSITPTTIADNNSYAIFNSRGYSGKALAVFRGVSPGTPTGLYTGFPGSYFTAGVSQFGAGKGQGGNGALLTHTPAGAAQNGANGTPGIVVIEY